MNLISIITNLRFQDVLDILFLSVMAYYLYLWFQGTKAFKALVGLLVLGLVFTAARTWGLFLTTWVFQILWQVLVILLIILFQSEIRQVLEKVNPLKAIGFQKLPDPGEWIPKFSEGVFKLAERKIGALIILERIDRIDEWITGGIQLEGDPNRELLMSIFHKESPLHDGAIVIRNGRIIMASTYLPLSISEDMPSEWGTRHRAAIGITEKCDAWVIVVSEERGNVSLAREGRMVEAVGIKDFSRLAFEAITPMVPPKSTWIKRLHSLLTNRWPVKLGSLALISILWLLLAGQQDFQVNLNIPLGLKNIPPDMEFVGPLNPEVMLTIRGLRKDASTLNERNIIAEVDLSLATEGRKDYPITRDQIILPNDRIQVIRIEPSKMEFEFKKKN